MLTLKTELKYAEKTKNFLLKNKLMDFNFLPKKEEKWIYFPITQKVKLIGTSIVYLKLPEKEKVLTVEEILKTNLTPEEIKRIPHSQEIVGNILILEIPQELNKKERLIARAFLKTHQNIKTVVKKDKAHGGEFRLRKVKILAGEKTKETIHLENKVKLKIDLEKTYFSARLGNERLRIAHLIKHPEEVLVMFSGAAPYPLVIAKNSLAKEI